MRHTTSKKDIEKKDNECPGVCVADRIADYCEAYLRTPNLCKGGTKCCVAKDQYIDDPDLRILINTQNSSKAPSKPQKTPEKVSSSSLNMPIVVLKSLFSHFSTFFVHYLDSFRAIKVKNESTKVFENNKETISAAIKACTWRSRSSS